MEVLKVSAHSQPKSVAGALAAVLRDKATAEIQAVGAGAVNQQLKQLQLQEVCSTEWYRPGSGPGVFRNRNRRGG